MRLRDTFIRTLHDQLRPVGIWAIVAMLLVAFYMALYPSIGAAEEMQRMMEELPPAFRALFAAEGLDLASAEGYLNIELFSFVGPILLLAYTLSAASGATAAEEERGTIDLLLSTPTTRRRVLLEKAAAIASLSMVLALAMWTGVALGGTVGGVSVDLGRVGGALLSMLLLALAYGAVALLLGAWTGRRTVSLAVAAALALVGYVVNGLGTIVDWLEPWRPASLFFHYLAGDPLTHGLDPAHAAVLLAVAALALVAATVAFDRRELRG